MCILSIDLGKSKSVACVYEAENGNHKFSSFRTNPQEIYNLMVENSPDRVVIEICSIAGWVGDIVRDLGIELQVANTNHEAWRWRHVKRKTDRDDALKLAKLSAMNQLPLVYLPEYKVRQWRSLIQYRQRLVSRCTSVKNRIRSILAAQGLDLLPSGKAGWTKKSLKLLQEHACSLDKTDMETLWRGELVEELQHLERLEESLNRVECKLEALAAGDKRVQLLRTAGGVGRRLAEMVVSVIDDPHRFKNGKQVGSYAGLTPRQFQSGSMDRQGRISRAGHRNLRALLVEVSWAALRYNPWARQIYKRVRAGSKTRKKIAIIAVARRLLIRCWAMLRDNRPWKTKKPMVTEVLQI